MDILGVLENLQVPVLFTHWHFLFNIQVICNKRQEMVLMLKKIKFISNLYRIYDTQSVISLSSCL